MKYPRLLIVASLSASVPALATAEVRELTQSELRSAVHQNQTIATRNLIAGVENYTGGSVVEIRSFLVDTDVTYRVLVRQPDGQLGAIMVNGSNGQAVSPSSPAGQQVTREVAGNKATVTTRSKSPSATAASPATNSTRTSGSNASSRSSNGNSGGNGNGNSGGNGNGNSGGNGNGNSGGNGNGKNKNK